MVVVMERTVIMIVIVIETAILTAVEGRAGDAGSGRG